MINDKDVVHVNSGTYATRKEPSNKIRSAIEESNWLEWVKPKDKPHGELKSGFYVGGSTNSLVTK